MKGREVVALVLVAVLLAAGHLGPVDCQSTLSSTFYATSCPNVDQIVSDTVGAAINSSQIVGPSVLRLFAHDCFVGGCDGSILLQDTAGAPPVEKDASDNLSLQQLSFDTINLAKIAVEAECPGIVSCADILALASEDVVSMMGGPAWTVILGRRDGLNSSAASVADHLPGSDMDVTQLMGIFASIGLSQQDLVTLSGAHTVGFAHCNEFTSRLYNFNNVSGTSDPSLSASYLATLQSLCPNGNFSNSTAQALDTTSPGTFDNAYYQQLQVGRGLLFSDEVIYVDNTTTNLVTTYANNQQQFFTDFATSMIAMSQVGVLTGTQGEIRLNCSFVNGPNSVPGNSTVPPTNSTIPPSNSTIPPSNSTVPPSNSTTPPSNSTTPAPVLPTPTPVVTPSSPPAVTPALPPTPVVTPSPLTPVVTPSPLTPVVTPSPSPIPVVTPSPPPPVVTPSPPLTPVVTPSPSPIPVVTPSPPPPVVTPSPVGTPSPPPVVTPSSPPVVTPSPPPTPVVTPPPPPTPEVTPSPPRPAPKVTPSPPLPAPKVTPSPPLPVPKVTPSPPAPAPVVIPSPPPPVATVTPSPPPKSVVDPPPPGGRRRS